MREDFFYRIHIIPITLPPLRERKDDLPLLIEHFLSIYANSGNMPVLDGNVLGMLYNYEWPGNVRELQNVLQRYITLNTLDFMSTSVPKSVLLEDFDPVDISENADSLSQAMDNFEKNIIRSVLKKNQWRKNRAASELNINRKTLFRKMQKYGLS